MLSPPKSNRAGEPLSKQVAEVLILDIRAGRLAVGSKLPTEAALVAQFEVSRTVVREAVARLKSLGLVDSRQGSGVYVKADFSPLNFDAKYAVSKQAVIQMVEVRRALEAEVAAMAARRCTPADARHIQSLMAALDAAVQSGGDGVAEDVRFHSAIAELANNPFLMGTLAYLGQFLHGATRVTRANEARREDFTRAVREEHALIYRALACGDAAQARQAATDHMNNAIGRIEQADPAFWQQAGEELARPLVSGLQDKKHTRRP